MGFFSLRRDENPSLLQGSLGSASRARRSGRSRVENELPNMAKKSLSLPTSSVGLIGKQLARRTVRSRCEKGTHSERTRGMQTMYHAGIFPLSVCTVCTTKPVSHPFAWPSFSFCRSCLETMRTMAGWSSAGADGQSPGSTTKPSSPSSPS